MSDTPTGKPEADKPQDPLGPLGPPRFSSEKSHTSSYRAYKMDELFEEDDDLPEFHWSVPWADLMMTMFIMFTVLFVYASAKQDYLQAFRGHVELERPQEMSEVGTKSGPVAAYDIPKSGILPDVGPQQLFEMCNAAVSDAALKDVSVEMQGDEIRISMHGPLLFDRTRAEIKPGGMRFLDAIATVIAKARYDVHIHGHTDNFPVSSPRHPTNWELSAARAINVGRFLIEQKRVDPAQVIASAHSMYHPSTPNLTTEGKSRNRRVEIVLARPETAMIQKVPQQ